MDSEPADTRPGPCTSNVEPCVLNRMTNRFFEQQFRKILRTAIWNATSNAIFESFQQAATVELPFRALWQRWGKFEPSSRMLLQPFQAPLQHGSSCGQPFRTPTNVRRPFSKARRRSASNGGLRALLLGQVRLKPIRHSSDFFYICNQISSFV